MIRELDPRVPRVITQQGLGDCIYNRPTIKALLSRHEKIVIESPWPQVFMDLPNVIFNHIHTNLRTQKLVMADFKGWSDYYPTYKNYTMTYGLKHFDGGDSITDAYESIIPLGGMPFVIDMPQRLATPPIIDSKGKPIAVIKAVCERGEWLNVSRNPKWEYINWIADQLRAKGYFIVSIADIDPGHEWLAGPAPDADLYLHQRELSIYETIELIRQSHVAVGGVSWLVPVVTALQIPSIIVLGGHGAANAPEHVLDRRIPAPWIGWMRPRYYCRCAHIDHKCNKEIPDLEEQFNAWWERVQAWSIDSLKTYHVDNSGGSNSSASDT